MPVAGLVYFLRVCVEFLRVHRISQKNIDAKHTVNFKRPNFFAECSKDKGRKIFRSTSLFRRTGPSIRKPPTPTRSDMTKNDLPDKYTSQHDDTRRGPIPRLNHLQIQYDSTNRKSKGHFNKMINVRLRGEKMEIKEKDKSVDVPKMRQESKF